MVYTKLGPFVDGGAPYLAHDTFNHLEGGIAYAAETARNIKTYGALGDGMTDDAAAINAAFTANPGAAFYFPPGTYLVKAPLLPGPTSNSLVLHREATIKAGAAMANLIDLRWTGTYSSFADLAHDNIVSGGTFDCALLASTGLTSSGQMRLRLTGFTVKDFLTAGLTTASPGAEVLAHQLAFINTTTSNVAGNIGINNTLQDCQYRDIILTDCTTGVHDQGNGTFTNVHPWLSQAARIPGSIAFDINGSTDLINCYADTFQTLFNIGGGDVRIISPRIFFDGGYYTTALAGTNPPKVFNIASGAAVHLDHGIAYGHPTVTTPFTTGDTSKLTVTDITVDSHISGYFEWRKGIRQGLTTFTPILKGSTTAGSHTYTTQLGVMEVADRNVTYVIKLIGTFDSTLAGTLRIGGVPAVTGGTGSDGGSGIIGFQQNVGNLRSAIMLSGTADTEIRLQTVDVNGATVDVTAASLQGKAFNVWVTLTTTAEG